MKTVKKNAGEEVEVRRVTDQVAHTMVKGEGWSYCPKSEWKKTHKPQAPKPVKEDKSEAKEIKKKAEKGKRAYMEAKADKQGK